MTYQSAIPVLPSFDIKQSCDFFVEKLGFDLNFIWQEEKDKPAPYGGVKSGETHIHFVIVDDKKVCEWTICRIYVEDIETHYKNAQAADIVHPNGALEEKPWGDKEFSVLDPFGVCLHIAQALNG
jgi:hypothetical protein